MTTSHIARSISVVSHPFILSAIATLLSASNHHASVALTHELILIIAVLGFIAISFSAWHVRTGRWQHVDAVKPHERKVLNGFLAVLMLLSSLLAWRYFPEPELAYGLLIAGTAIVIALLLSRWLKLSLHSCFAAIAAGILWPSLIALGIGIIITAAVYWSRLILQRHTLAELIAGSASGCVCALVYQVLSAAHYARV
ncbi:MAG TPA: hypothetical protein VG962_03350 [Steroidobacteraceae bacterium]|nr:hypothetical protein [Steroidobacteraceae bacterium]